MDVSPESNCVVSILPVIVIYLSHARSVFHNETQRRPATGHRAACRECRVTNPYFVDHARRAVSDDDLRTVLDLVADDRASVIDGRLLVGGFKAMIAECARDARTGVFARGEAPGSVFGAWENTR